MLLAQRSGRRLLSHGGAVGAAGALESLWAGRPYSDLASFPYEPKEFLDISVARSRGVDVLHDPVFNKGTAHPLVERERLGLRGLLPPRVLTMEQQKARALDRYWHGQDWIDPSQIESGGVAHEHTRKWLYLQELQDRNETLFYRLLCENFVEMAPIIYTPTVGWACINYHKLYRRPRGMYFSANDRGEMASMVWNWPHENVDAIVVTDGSRILGLGDLGTNGLGIPVGKLDLYVGAGGFNPGRVLPCVIDVGTNNEMLRNEPWYMGLKQPRLRGDAYYEIVDEFVQAVMGRWPRAVLQFEDFNIEHASPLLDRYRYSHCVFNDDVQGTAGTAVGGLYGAMAVAGKPPSALADQKFVVLGAGSAGMGVVSMIAQGMVKHGLSPQEAASRFYVLNHHGLITEQRADLEPHVKPFARKDADSKEGESFIDVVRRVKPTALIGLAGAGRLFTPDALKLMAQYNERPIIMPMSNPTSKMECTHAEAQKYCQGRAIFASGSPQPDVEVDGKKCAASQANNMYIFPGLAMGAFLARGNIVTDNMLMAAAESLVEEITPEELAEGRVYPNMHKIRSISLNVALETMKAAAEEGHLHNENAMRELSRGDENLRNYIHKHMFWPQYSNLIPAGHPNTASPV
ncbi:malic enzyme [Micractinium conductrix]|uniref:Malic enzyme n=1 Tax=Micractinium conductrix TaxID=554055 RepID=A0A2P6VLH0_9CHLO|nr:malic enzyme [Micractinium conductrix]|eukprot:PSC74934.1 malic enzyme [Micractinium conductrix]